jgi:hypothetical protein
MRSLFNAYIARPQRVSGKYGILTIIDVANELL